MEKYVNEVFAILTLYKQYIELVGDSGVTGRGRSDFLFALQLVRIRTQTTTLAMN